jgi:hypothetical protein
MSKTMKIAIVAGIVILFYLYKTGKLGNLIPNSSPDSNTGKYEPANTVASSGSTAPAVNAVSTLQTPTTGAVSRASIFDVTKKLSSAISKSGL